MGMKLRLAGVQDDSIVDGPGIRLTVFAQGCPHRCPGCHNPQTHDPEGGYWEEEAALLQRLGENPLLRGITLSGGEPFLQAEAFANLAKKVHAMGKDVVCYTGYTFEQLFDMQDRHVHALLDHIDILVDGPYIEAQRDLELLFRGSANQRLIALPETLRTGKVCLWEQG